MKHQLNSNTKNEDTIIIDFSEIAYNLRKFVGLIILVTLFTTGIGAAITYFVKTPQYQSDVMLYFRTEGSNTNETLQGLQIGSQILHDYQVILHSEPLAQKVIDELNLKMKPSQLLKQITVSEFDQTHILKASIKSESPYQAQKIASSFADNAVSLVGKIEKNAPYLIEQPKVNLTPVSPSHHKDIAIGALAGLLISVGFVVFKTILNDKLKKVDDIERILGLPVIGLVPKEASFQFEEKRK